MIVTSTLFGALSKALKTVIPERGDTSLTFREVAATISLPIPFFCDGLINDPTIKRTSGAWRNGNTITNSAGDTGLVVTLGEGVWDITTNSYYSSNFISNSGGVPDGAARMSALSISGSCSYHVYFSAGTATQPSNMNTVTRFTLTVDDPLGVNFNYFLGSCGAAQTHKIHVSVVAMKLL